MVRRLLSLPEAEEQTAAAEEPQTTYEADNGEECSGPQESLEEVSRTGRGAGRETKLVETVTGDNNRESGVRENPGRRQMRSERLVRIIKRLLCSRPARCKVIEHA